MATDTVNRFRKWHEANGLIDVKRLTAGTRIALTTENEHYELEVGTPEFGVVLVASDGRYHHREKAILKGSRSADGLFLEDVIGEGLMVVLNFCYRPTSRTQPVLAAKVVGPDGSYEYQLWED